MSQGFVILFRFLLYGTIILAQYTLCKKLMTLQFPDFYNSDPEGNAMQLFVC